MKFQYVVRKDYYASLPVPGFPQMRNHMFTIQAKYLPYEVPHGANPRHQNIMKAAYAPVRESFKDKNDMTFHLKNRGITVLANSVEVSSLGPDWLSLMVDVPTELGNVDGHHSYEIVSKFREENPDQMINIFIREKMPEELTVRVAEALNTSVQVTKDSTANKRAWFEPIKEAVKNKQYAEWISYSENQPNVTAPVKNVLKILWVSNPLLYQSSEKHPGWIYTKANLVFEKGFHSSDLLRSQLMKAAPLLPELIDIFLYVNETTHLLAPKRERASRSKHKDLSGQPRRESSIRSLCVNEELQFRPPGSRGPHLREQYVMMVLSGFKNLIVIDPTTKNLSWQGDREDLFAIIRRCHKRVMNNILKQFKHDGSDHNKTRSQPSLWNLVESEVGREAEAYFSEKKAQIPASFPPLAYLPLPSRRS